MYREIVVGCKKIGGEVLAGDPAPLLRARAPQAQLVVDRAISYQQSESADWLRTWKCAACHHAPLPLWPLAEAQRQGYAIDKKPWRR